MPSSDSIIVQSSLGPHSNPTQQVLYYYPITQMRKLRHRAIENCPTHMAKQQESQDSNASSLAPGSVATCTPLAVLPHLRQNKNKGEGSIILTFKNITK